MLKKKLDFILFYKSRISNNIECGGRRMPKKSRFPVTHGYTITGYADPWSSVWNCISVASVKDSMYIDEVFLNSFAKFGHKISFQ